MIHGNNKFILEIVPLNHRYLKSIRSEPMFVVTHELIIEQLPPLLWYKDQGGRDNFIEIKVRLVDHHHLTVTSRRVPLKVSLYYESGVLVPKQEILRLEGEMVILERKGEAIIKFRIEEVSRSHQRQKFVVRISPDTHAYPRNNDINPVDTPPIEVMSKPKGEKNQNAIQSTLRGPMTETSFYMKSDKPLLSVPLPGLAPTTTTAGGGAPILSSISSSKKRSREDDDGENNNNENDGVRLENEEIDVSYYSSNLSELHSSNNNNNNNNKKYQSEIVTSMIASHQQVIEELLKMNHSILSEYIK